MSRQHSWHAHLRRFAFTSLLLLGVATSAFAQFDRGTITGTVKDAQGGIVPGVTVTLTSTQTQQVRSTVTDGSGFYTFPNLTAGRYEIAAELSGFKKISRSNVQLDAAGALSLDFTLETGALTEEVTVTAETHGAADAGRGQKVGRGQGHRTVVVFGPESHRRAGAEGRRRRRKLQQRRVLGSLTNGGFSINGGRDRRQHDHGRRRGRPFAPVRRAPQSACRMSTSIQEVQVLTANYMPEYGRASAGQIRFVTKSGSNRYTGNASYFYRDDSLQANTWARNLSPNADRELRRRAVRLQAVRLLVRRSDTGQGQAVLLRRAGMGQLLRRADQSGDVPTAAMRARRLQPAAGRESVLQLAADRSRPADRPAVPRQHHPDEPAVGERHRAA